MNLKDYVIKVVYKLDGKTYIANDDNDVLTFVDNGDENHIKMTVTAGKPIELILAELVYEHSFEGELFFGNGYQSWSTAKEYKKGDKQRGLLFPCNAIPLAKTFATASGDSAFTEYGKDLYHSHTYTYLRNGDDLELWGTLNDYTGYTIFYADMRENVFAIEKEVEGLTIDGAYQLFDIVKINGNYEEVFDKYFAEYPANATGRVDHFAGYTSWYNYFQNITESIIMRDLEGMYDKVGDKANIFQIDDGYESFVGDWLVVDKDKFPKGMGYLADEIHKRGYKAGLWLAPFAAQFKSKVAKEHPEWLVRDGNGKKVIGGFAWNGFYVLDIEQPEVRAYVKEVFRTVFEEWGYDMVKLDFLYSAAIIPRNNKTRGQLMHEAMDFLRECCGDNIILGCGVPLGASWGKVDACRISCDVELSFKDKFYVKVTNPEIVSAKNAMNNSIFRRHLNKRIFANDPDVFFLRDDGMKPAVFTDGQKELLAKINHIFGDVLFVSDNIGNYDDKKLEILQNAYLPFDGQVHKAEYLDDQHISIDYTENGQRQTMVYDVLSGENQTVLTK